MSRTKAAEVVKLKPIQVSTMRVTVTGTTPLVQHKWSEKALRQMREKHAGKKTKNREIRNPEEEYLAAMYRTQDGEYGVPVDAIKASFIGAAHKDIGIEKTLVRKSLFIRCNDANRVLPMRCSDPIMREDYVRVGQSTDLRYRPEFREWEVDLDIDIDTGNLTTTDVVNLIQRAGFGVGIGEMRPEKGKEYGRYRVKESEA